MDEAITEQINELVPILHIGKLVVLKNKIPGGKVILTAEFKGVVIWVVNVKV